MARSGWAALVATVLLVAGLGSKPALDATADADRKVQPLLHALTDFPAWSVKAMGFDSDMYGPIAVKIVVLLVLVFLLARAAGHVGASGAAFLAGWGALMIASAVAGVAFVVVADTWVLDGQLADNNGGAAAVVVDAINSGVVFALYTGWLVGAVVVLTARPGGLKAAGGWRASPPSRTLPVPPGEAADGTATPAAAPGVATGALGTPAIVPNMPSVSASAPPGPTTLDDWPSPARAQPVANNGAPGAYSWSQPAGPGPTGSGEPFIPGGWPSQASPTPQAPAAGPSVRPGSWPPSSRSDAVGNDQAPSSPAAPTDVPASASGPIVPTGSWPPSSRPDAGTPPGSDRPPAAPTWSTDQPSPPAYEQPEYSGLAPSEPAQADQPEQPGRPLWPTTWPSSAGGAYTEEPDVYTTADVRRQQPDENGNGQRSTNGRGPSAPSGEKRDESKGDDDPEDPLTRFW